MALCCSAACAPAPEHRAEEPRLPAPPRGVVVVSVDTLRADHLGAYGYSRDTSPRLDALAEESVVFEAAVAQAPSTLTSHLALFTSLLPPEFFPIADAPVPVEGQALSPEIETFPELFRAAGFRTAGHTEGGYVSSVYGFGRGFEDWTDPSSTSSTDVEQTVDRGLDFLRCMAERREERFLLFLHTYSVHDPYDPPEPYRGMFTRELFGAEPPTRDPATARTLLDVNAGERPTNEQEARYFEARYDEGIRYADEVLGRLWDGLAELGLAGEVAVVVTSDHGEEFMEHGRYLHTQLYPEQLHVPLLVRAPGVAPRRIEEPVRSIDVAPTLLELMGLGPLPRASGRSLMPWLVSENGSLDPEPGAGPPICGVTWDSGTKVEMTLLQRKTDPKSAPKTDRADLLWVLRQKPPTDPEGAWISDALDFDLPFESAGALRLLAFHQARRIRLVGEDGDLILEREVPAAWTDVELPGEALGQRLRLEVDGCESPERLGLGDDPRCLGVQMARPVLQRRKYYSGFPEVPPAHLTRVRPGPAVGVRIEEELARCSPPLLAESAGVRPIDADRQGLCALGYLSEEECSMESE